MKWTANYKIIAAGPGRRAALWTLLVLLIFYSPIWWISDNWYKNRLLEEHRYPCSLEIGLLGNALSRAVDKRFALLNGLYAYTRTHVIRGGSDEEFNTFAEGLYSGSRGIRNFAIAPGGVQQYVYPMKGNENVPGHDLINDSRPETQADVQQAIRTGKTAISGPYKLRQDGLGLVARRALFRDGVFWGLVTMVIDVQPVLEEAGITDKQLGVELALRDKNGNIFFGSEQVFESSPVTVLIELQEGHWELAGVPKGGWQASLLQDLRFFRAYGLLVMALITSLTYLVITRQTYLQATVSKRTSELEEANVKLLQEINERRKTEEQLRKLTRAVECSASSIVITDRTGNIEYVNPKFTEVTGYTFEEAAGKKPSILKSGETPPEEYKRLWEIISSGGQWEGSFHNKKKTGDLFWEYATISPIKNDAGSITHFIAVKEDITEHKKLEAQLVQAQKMEAVGQLAGGVAHDFNNILSAIISYGYLLKGRVKEDAQSTEFTDRILSLSDRAAQITRGLLAFSRKQHFEFTPAGLNDIIRNVENLLTKFIGEDVELKIMLTDEEPVIIADKNQIEQVIINLATNARDAMPEGGSFTIETELVEIDEQFIKSHGYGDPGVYALLSVTDTGMGMDEGTRQKIFEPFFTTKEVGRGTGLGLSIVYGIVKQHNGYINVYSEPGKGAAFRMYFPIIRARGEKEVVEKLPDLRGGGQTILVAEDEAAVRDSLKKLLEEFGYKVMEAVDGIDAIEKFRQASDKIRLVILDVVMPGKNGKDTLDEIKKLSPEIKAIFTSGYTADIIHRKKILEENVIFVSKPIIPNKFLLKVKEAFENA